MFSKLSIVVRDFIFYLYSWIYFFFFLNLQNVSCFLALLQRKESFLIFSTVRCHIRNIANAFYLKSSQNIFVYGIVVNTLKFGEEMCVVIASHSRQWKVPL